MILIGVLLGFTPLVSDACIPMGSEPHHRSIRSSYKLARVRDGLQSTMLKRLDHKSLLPLTHSEAVEATGDSRLHARHYYLARVGYVANPQYTGIVPHSLALSVDAAGAGIVYVTSYILSVQNGTVPVAVVLTSRTPIRRVVAVCGAAK